MKQISVPVLVKELVQSKNSIKNPINSYKNVIAVQHNSLIEAKYSMTLQQKRIMIWLISQIMPNDIDFKEHVLSIKELIDLCQLSGESSYKEIKDITFSLVEKGIRIIDISDPNNSREIHVSWLSSADYYRGQVKLSFSPKLKPYLLKLKNQFTVVNTLDLMQFKSVHAIRLYELLKQYQDIGERTLGLDEIKECCGIKGKLKKYSDFEKRLLLISQREINKKSDIKFEFERIKNGRKIVAIKFLISSNKAYTLKNNPEIDTKEDKRKPSIIYTLKDFGLSKKIINQLLKEYTKEALDNAVRAIDIQISKGQVRNAKAMLLAAIKEGWHPDRYTKKN
jgi:plasmid replication initiation protein